MHDAIRTMLSRYARRTADDHVAALRGILQELALLGLWRARFFEKAAFYGGTALRVLHGLNRFSEDLDFSLLDPDPGFSLRAYGERLVREIASFGFQVELSARAVPRTGPIESAFLKANTLRHLVWYVGRNTPVRIPHLESRMRQSGDYTDSAPLTATRLLELLADAVAALDVSSARAEVAPFLRDPRSIGVWSKDFFLAVAARIQSV